MLRLVGGPVRRPVAGLVLGLVRGLVGGGGGVVVVVGVVNLGRTIARARGPVAVPGSAIAVGGRAVTVGSVESTGGRAVSVVWGGRREGEGGEQRQEESVLE